MDILAVSFVHTTCKGVVGISARCQTPDREGNYEGRNRNPIYHAPNIGKIEIVNHFYAHFVSAFEFIALDFTAN